MSNLNDSTSQTQQIDSLVKKLSQATSCLKKEKNEADRVAAIKAAQELIQTLEDPRDAIIKLAFAVSFGPRYSASET